MREVAPVRRLSGGADARSDCDEQPRVTAAAATRGTTFADAPVEPRLRKRQRGRGTAAPGTTIADAPVEPPSKKQPGRRMAAPDTTSADVPDEPLRKNKQPRGKNAILPTTSTNTPYEPLQSKKPRGSRTAVPNTTSTDAPDEPLPSEKTPGRRAVTPSMTSADGPDEPDEPLPNKKLPRSITAALRMTSADEAAEFAEPLPSKKQQQPGLTSKYLGVCWDAAKRKWRSQLMVGAKNRLLGLFDVEELAAQAYLKAAPAGRFTSKYLGVSWSTRLGKWRAEMRVKQKRRRLGFFDNELDAARAYIAARAQLRESGGTDDDSDDEDAISEPKKGRE